ncbi:hypothetical protein OSTOST_16585 [Ostertagia ostertagi]
MGGSLTLVSSGTNVNQRSNERPENRRKKIEFRSSLNIKFLLFSIDMLNLILQIIELLNTLVVGGSVQYWRRNDSFERLHGLDQHEFRELLRMPKMGNPLYNFAGAVQYFNYQAWLACSVAIQNHKKPSNKDSSMQQERYLLIAVRTEDKNSQSEQRKAGKRKKIKKNGKKSVVELH